MKSMLRRKLPWLPMVAVAIAIAACGDQGRLPLEPAPGSDGAMFAKGGNGQGREKAPRVRGKKDGTVRDFRLAVGQVPDVELKSEALVQPDEPAWLGAAGHVLYVPAGAVDEPTTFKIRQINLSVGDLDEVVVGVSLSALRTDASGAEVNVGEQGFNTPVYLGLTYSWASNMSPSDVNNATVLWLQSAVAGEEMPVVWRGKWYDGYMVVAELSHFSQYALAFP